ncbi:MAG: hypothetical protein FJ244_08275 [Nitrospira sp.]|nr:hypothetical protein [Nitrospira sp.]
MRLLASLCVFTLLATGCSVYKVATQPGPADLGSIGVGVPRTTLIAKIGPPKFSDTDPQGNKQDTFEFESGFHQGSKARIIPYVAADVLTFGLAELVLWPMELTVMERATCVGVATYDNDQKVQTWTVRQKGGVQGC